MNISNKKPLIYHILTGDIISAMNYLKGVYGVSEGFICNKADVKLSTYCLYKKGQIKILGADKRDALLKTIKEMYL